MNLATLVEEEVEDLYKEFRVKASKLILNALEQVLQTYIKEPRKVKIYKTISGDLKRLEVEGLDKKQVEKLNRELMKLQRIARRYCKCIITFDVKEILREMNCQVEEVLVISFLN